jgi:hypothetical protein
VEAGITLGGRSAVRKPSLPSSGQPGQREAQLLYFTLQPYGVVEGVGTGLPPSNASTAVFT